MSVSRNTGSRGSTANTTKHDSLNIFQYSLNPLPPPEQFKDRNYYDFVAASHGQIHDETSMWFAEEKDSPTGRAVRFLVSNSHYYDMPFAIGFYDEGNAKTIEEKLFDKIPDNTGYNWFRLDKPVKIPVNGYVFVTRRWTLQIPLNGFKELIGKEFEVWVSAKHVGEQFHPSQKGQPERISVDRMLLVEPLNK